MRKLLIIALLPVALFVSCKKSETELPPPPIPENESPTFSWDHTPGSYYVYQWYTIDSLGNETPFGAPDSNIVVGDTVINGHTYTTFDKTYHIFFNYGVFYWRDSSGYVVDQGGNIQFSYTAFNDTVQESEIPDWFTLHHILGSSITLVNVPAGEFDVYHQRRAFELADGVAPPPCTHPLGHDYYFDAKKGFPVIQQTGSFSDYLSTCTYYERRLIDYYIAE